MRFPPFSLAMNRSTVLVGGPLASNVTFTGTLAEGETLTGDYDYTDPDGLPESGTTYQWYRSATGTGSGTAIVGATSLTYLVDAADVGEYLRFGVTPSNGTTTGAEKFSAWEEIPVPGVPVDLLLRSAAQKGDSAENLLLRTQAEK